MIFKHGDGRELLVLAFDFYLLYGIIRIRKLRGENVLSRVELVVLPHHVHGMIYTANGSWCGFS